jgi:hypothetical protein
MAISDFKPIDDNSTTPNGEYHDANMPVGAAIAHRLVNNIQFTAQNRLAKQSKTWDCTIADDENLTTFSGSAGDATTIMGYSGSVGGLSQADDQTVGLEVSTHPSVPLAIPFGWRLSPGARRIHVRVAVDVQNMTGSMYAYGVDQGGRTFPRVGATDEVPSEMAFAPATNFFTTEIRAESSYAEMGPTSLSGTGGLSYYDLEIEVPGRLDGGGTPNINYKQDNVTIFLCIQSGVDQTVGVSAGINPTSPALFTGNRVINLNNSMAKYIQQRNPGKYHRVCKFDYTGTDRTSSWHQVVQMRPADVTLAPYDSLNPESFILWPAIPPDVVPASLVGGAGSNAGAAPGTGLQNGDTFTIYPVTRFNIYSVTIEESFA